MYLCYRDADSPAFGKSKDFYANLQFYRASSVNSGANDNYCIALDSELDEVSCQEQSFVNNYYNNNSSNDLETYTQVIIAISGATFILIVAVLAYVLLASRNKSPMGGSIKSDL
jgi:hypothetical protein